MALFHLSCKVRGRSSGASGVAASAYRSASLLRCEETGQEIDYRRKRGVVHSEIVLPENAPDWAADRQTLWNAVHAKETRKNSQFFREFDVALPHELDADVRLKLAQDFCGVLADLGMVVDLAIHDPGANSNEKNFHFHAMCSTRGFSENGEWAKNKDRSWKHRDLLISLRETWATLCNEALSKANIAERVDHRSLEAQHDAALAAGDGLLAATLDRLPEPHLGHSAHAMEVKAQKRAKQAGEPYEPVTELGQMRQEAVVHRNLLHRLADDVRFAAAAVKKAVEAVAVAAREAIDRPISPERPDIFSFKEKSSGQSPEPEQEPAPDQTPSIFDMGP